MPRSTGNVACHHRRKRLMKRAKGYYGARSKQYRTAIAATIKAGVYAFRDRRQKRREFRKLWILRISAATRARGMSYSRFIDGLQKANVPLDRKILAALAVEEPDTFDRLVETAKTALAA